MAAIPEVSKRYKHPDPPKRGAWCFYCGKTQPWFWCECAEALEARAGKRERPKYQRIDGKNVIVLEADLLERPWNAKRLPVHKPAAVNPISAPELTGAVNKVNSEGSVNSEGVDRQERDKAYHREYMRKRRAKG